MLVLGGALATVTRYVALKTWVFARGRRDGVVPALVAEREPS